MDIFVMTVMMEHERQLREAEHMHRIVEARTPKPKRPRRFGRTK